MAHPPDDSVNAFLRAATLGDRETAETLLRAQPAIAGANVFVASVLGDDALVRGFLANDPTRATASGGPHGWAPLTYVCFSRYLAPDDARSSGFVRAAEALLAAGASVNSGFMTKGGQHAPEWECVLYGAAGVAHHPELTALLLEHGADANDGEVTYHTPESYDLRALRVLVEHGTLTADSLSTMLLRKCDWHDLAGIDYLLSHGADPNRDTIWHRTAFYQAVIRDNWHGIIARLLDAGADPRRGTDAESSLLRAARDGRRDVLELCAARGFVLDAAGTDAVLQACTLADRQRALGIARAHPEAMAPLLANGGPTLTEFAGIGNVEGLQVLLELGVPIDACNTVGDGYWGISADSTALHVAAQRARHDVVRLLIDRGANVNARDTRGRTPLMHAVTACVDSFWMDTRKPDSVARLLAAGAIRDGVSLPTGYDEIDALLM